MKSKNIVLPYKVFHFNNDFSPSIKFSESIFFTQEGLIVTNKRDVYFKSREDYDSLKNEITEQEKERIVPATEIRAKKLVIDNLDNLDAFTSKRSGIDFFISKRLAVDLMQHGVTGVDI